MSSNREILNVSYNEEHFLISSIWSSLSKDGFDANNTVVVTVSIDYSSIVGQMLRHLLSADGEICEGFGIDVPYPDEHWDERYIKELDSVFAVHKDKMHNKRALLVEAGVIRGGNYTFIDKYLRENGVNDIYTVALFENTGSVYKSNYVGRYYDDTKEDLTFSWEKSNKHWR